ncbi:MAG: hypothetical protein OHK0052_10530 [Anaerolineales bacterium]
MTHPSRKNTFFLTFLILLVFLAACAAPAPTNSPAPTETSAGANENPAPKATTPPASQTAAPAASPTPQPQRILLIGALPAEAQSTLAELAAANGFAVQLLPTLLPADLTAETRLIVLANPLEDLSTLLAAAPEIPFWVLNAPADIVAPNLVRLQAEIDPGKRGFFAGYTAAILTEDWRTGALVLDDTEGQALRTGFVNGGKYFCGLCRSMYPPFAAYPLYVEIPSGSSDEARIAAANLLLEQGVTTVFLGAGVATEALINHLSAAEIILLGSESPPGGENPFWAATLRADVQSAIKAEWQAWQSGGSSTAPAALTFTNVNADLFSPGKQQRALAILPDLLAGYLQTEPVP